MTDEAVVITNNPTKPAGWCSLTPFAVPWALQLVRGRWRWSARCSGEQRKGGGEDRADSSLLELNFAADVLWSQASKQGRRSSSTEQVDQIQHPRCLCGR